VAESSPPPPADQPPALSPALAAGLVFLASGAVLVLEILGVRLLAPYVGLTLETTTSIIGVVLGGIAAGSALGGRMADRTDPRRLVPVLLVAGGLLALLTVPIVRLLGPAVRDGGDFGAFVVTLFALLPAAAALSAVTPCVARLQLRDLRQSGSTYGRLSAWATAGALAGTFGTGFVLVPLLAVSVSVLLVGTLLVLAGLAMGRVAGTATRASTGGVAGAALLAALVSVAAGSPCDAESTYHCARVITDPDRPSGRLLLLDDLRHSYVDLEDPRHLEFTYARWIADAVGGLAPAGRPLDAVFVGGGGFTLPRYLAAVRPGSRSQVLEVDRQVVDLARERLGLRTSPALRVTIGDARVSLRRAADDSADLVVGDAFGSRSVPWHLTTDEWLRDVRRVLRPGGLYALNLIDQRPRALLRAEAATFLQVFADVRLVRPAANGGNFVLLGSDRPLPAGVRSAAGGATTIGRRAVIDVVAGAEPLRDDHAPADQLLGAH
jgi:spermidine synthase